MSKHARALRDGLTTAAGIVQSDNRMGRPARDAAADVMLDDDIIGTMQASVALILALEEQAQAAKANAELARSALLAALEGTTGQVVAGIHTATVSKARAAVAVTDDALIPPSFMEQPPPRADKAAILKAIKAGATVPGAILRNGAPSLRIYVNTQDVKGTEE
jgi:Siphovirus Gp157